MAVVIEVVSTTVLKEDAVDSAKVIEVVSGSSTPINTTAAVSIVEAVGAGIIKPPVVSTTPPPAPYEGQVWIDVS